MMLPSLRTVYVALFYAAVLPALTWAQFETRATNPLPAGADCIAVGDFNHDGKLDVVVTDDNGFTVSLGNGDGTFQKPTFYKTQLSYFLAVGDFNNDGNLDIVVANYNQNPSTVSVYLGNGDGTFKAPIDSNTTSYNEFVAVGDFNGDNKLDIVLIENPHISVLLGNGDGTFQPPSDNDSFVGAHYLAVGDFNNDHKLDVLVAGFFGGSDSMGLLLGNGDGTLQNSITTPLTVVPFGLAAGQLSQTGNLDAVIGYLGAISVFRGNGDGTFQPEVFYEPTGLGGGPVLVADLNLDGKMDVATLSGPPGMDVFWGNGDGALQAAQFFASEPSALVTAGDLNGDRLPDFALANGLFGVTTMLNTGVVSFSPTTAPLAFPAQLVGSQSPAQKVTLTNNGATALSITSIKASGPFQMSNTCGSSVAPAAKCTISTVFKPKKAGTFGGLITIQDSASSKPQIIELSGSGTLIKVTPATLKFGSQKVGTSSPPQTVTVTNQDNVALAFTIGIAGTNRKDFSETDNCSGNPIQPGASCQVSVVFSPIKTGPRNALLPVTPQGTTSPASVNLTGTGQ